MDKEQLLQNLRDLSLEEGRVYIQEHRADLTDYEAVGNLLADEALHLLYSPFLSLKVAEVLIFFGAQTGHALSHALGLKAKGDALKGIGHHQAAMECLDAAGVEFLALGDERNWARSRISWIISCAWLGRVEEAFQAAGKAREIFLRHNEPYWACVIDDNTAAIYALSGKYEEALRLYERMLVIYPTLKDQDEAFIQRAIGIAENNQAVYLSFLGDFARANRLLRQAQARFLELDEVSCMVSTEINLADLDYTQGYYGSALRRYYQARDSMVSRSLDEPMLLAALRLRMADCLVKLNRQQEARPLAEEALQAYRQAGLSLSTGTALHEYAAILVTSGHIKDALTALAEAETLFTRGGFQHHAAIIKLQRAEALLMQGNYAEAYSLAEQVGQYAVAQGLVAYVVRAQLLSSSALIEQAARSREEKQRALLLQKASPLCQQATRQARRYNLREQTYRGQHLLGRVAVLRNEPAQAARHYAAAIAQIEQMLDDLAYDLSPAFLHTTWTVYEDMIALCLQQEKVERAFSYLEQARSMALRQYLNKSKAGHEPALEQDAASSARANSGVSLRIQQELKDWQETYRYYSTLLAEMDTTVSPTVDREILVREVKRCEDKIAELFERLHLHASTSPPVPAHAQAQKRARRRTRDVSIAQLRQRLAPDQLLLAYFLTKERLVIFAATPTQLVKYEIPDGGDRLELLLPLLHAHLEPGGWPNPQQPPQHAIRQLLNRLYTLLLAPAESLLPSSPGSLLVVPYGPLHKVPFHALYDGSHYLVERLQVSYLPASNMLLHFETPPQKEHASSKQPEAAASSPLVFGYSGRGNLQRALAEARTLATLLGGSCYLEQEATIARLIEQAPGSPVIHLATHGQSRLDAPNFSYVRLADGQLNAIDAFSLDLQGCELVTLSGCETGLALSGGGDEQLGLGRAFLAAGASSLVMSLWPVEDTSTNALMEFFYQRLLQGDSKIEALRAAQCHLAQQTSSIYTHPYFWAAFRLVGDGGPLYI